MAKLIYVANVGSNPSERATRRFLMYTQTDVVAIGDLYRFDRFAAPAALWEGLQQRYPKLLGAG